MKTNNDLRLFPLVRQIAQGLAAEAIGRRFAQGRDRADRVMNIGFGNVHGQRKVMLVDHDVDLDAPDLLGAVDAAFAADRSAAPLIV